MIKLFHAHRRESVHSRIHELLLLGVYLIIAIHILGALEHLLPEFLLIIALLCEETPKSFDYRHYKECKGPRISLNATGTLDVSYTVPEAKFRATNKFIPYINHYINLESETK